MRGSPSSPQHVAALRRLEGDRPTNGVEQVDLSADAVLPRRGVRVLEVGHEAPRSRVQRVDHHLPIDRAGDLDAAVGEVRRGRRHAPVARIELVLAARKSGSTDSSSRRRPRRRSRSSRRLPSNSRWSDATNANTSARSRLAPFPRSELERRCPSLPRLSSASQPSSQARRVRRCRGGGRPRAVRTPLDDRATVPPWSIGGFPGRAV